MHRKSIFYLNLDIFSDIYDIYMGKFQCHSNILTTPNNQWPKKIHDSKNDCCCLIVDLISINNVLLITEIFMYTIIFSQLLCSCHDWKNSRQLNEMFINMYLWDWISCDCNGFKINLNNWSLFWVHGLFWLCIVFCYFYYPKYIVDDGHLSSHDLT